jgi:sugar fermentation stimulation protein A
MPVRFEGVVRQAEFITRENRFAALVRLQGEKERVHVSNTGRMRELLVPGAPVLLQDMGHPGRATRWDLLAVRTGPTWVSVDSRAPNRLLEEALAMGKVSELAQYPTVHPEHSRGRSRFDFLLAGETRKALVEVKGCTLVREDGMALFPDAPTTRGARHVRDLSEARSEGLDAFLVIIIQRSDGHLFAPNDGTDRAFGDALRAAAKAGVRVLAYATEVSREGVELTRPVDVDLRAVLDGGVPS